ncbi:thioesterase family protein [Actinomadura macrotermitis]|uniref:Thioesterase family protein n=1 Tax=Actinomadura macrotermitis TaxID=2585200 RepID=A0A7K0C1T1_9ACTN|nr:thioesterase family protein [Actinomadura macrotermitis]MQY06744.1 hypothetical protein [Actinomadura macrotermitis]
MSRFGDATTIKQVGEGRYEAELDGAFGMAEAVNGGYLMALLGNAAVDATPHAHPVATATSFLRTAHPGRAEIVVDVRKVGRTAATARVTLRQDDRDAVEALVTTATLDAATEPSFLGEPPAPRLPALGDCVTFEDADRNPESFPGQVEMHFDPATMGWLDGEPSGRPELRGWFRLRDPHPNDAAALALAVDALPPVALNAGARGWSPTVELTWHMRAVPAPGRLALHGTGRLVAGGWFDEEVEVWDEAGRLVAQSRQIARLGRGPAA